MPFPAYPDVNGVRTSYCSTELGLDGIRLKGIKSVSYREVHEIGMIRGLSSHPIGRTRGMVAFEGEIEWYQAEWLANLDIITVGGTIGFAEASHTLAFTYAELRSREHTVLDVLEGVRIHSPETGIASDSVEAQVVKTPLSIMNILWGRGKYQGLRSRP